MKLISQKQLEDLTLRALFDYVQQNDGPLTTTEIARLVPGGFSISRVEMAIGAQENARNITGHHNAYSGSTYEITEKGYKLVEKQVLEEDDIDQELEGLAPASDRVVSFDHNSQDASDIVAAARELSQQLLEANDLGELSKDEAALAAIEVQQLGQSFDQPLIRPRAFVARSKSVLGWIGQQAAGALVGAAAMALLALIVQFFGFVG